MYFSRMVTLRFLALMLLAFTLLRTTVDAIAQSRQGAVQTAAPTILIEHAIPIKARDGANLIADLYRPTSPGRYPVVLCRTSSVRAELSVIATNFAEHGYVFVVESVRGCEGSAGEVNPFLQEGNDGFDAVEWCGAQIWSSGAVGLYGCGYDAFSAWMAAKSHPRFLQAMVSIGAMPGPPYGSPWDRGCFDIASLLTWYGEAKARFHRDAPNTKSLFKALNTLPLYLDYTVMFGDSDTSFVADLERTRYDAALKQSGYRDAIETVNLPVLHVGGWLAADSIGTRLNYMQMVGAERTNQKLIWGPWSRYSETGKSTGGWRYMPQSKLDLTAASLRWFDRWLKGIKNGVETEPAVSTMLLNEQSWEQAAEWPPPSMELQRWYIHGSPNPQYSGVLSTKPPKPTGDRPESYLYNPARYVASETNRIGFHSGLTSGVDLSALCSTAGRDRLLYQSEPLAKELRLCGPVMGRLWASSSAEDTDWVLALLDVAPSGTALPIATGFLRARFRESLAEPTTITRGLALEYTIDMAQVGVAIPAGHRLRLVVLSTLFPDLDRNLNTGGSIAHGTGIEEASQSVFHEAGKESYVVLPILPPIRPH